jgi:hypothetical protein
VPMMMMASMAPAARLARHHGGDEQGSDEQ